MYMDPSLPHLKTWPVWAGSHGLKDMSQSHILMEDGPGTEQRRHDDQDLRLQSCEF